MQKQNPFTTKHVKGIYDHQASPTEETKKDISVQRMVLDYLSRDRKNNNVSSVIKQNTANTIKINKMTGINKL